MPPRKIDPAEAVALRERGWTYQQIGERFGVSVNSARMAVIREQAKQKDRAKAERRQVKRIKKAAPAERARMQVMFSRQDRERISELQAHCGISRAADIVRLSVNTLASDIRKGRSPRELPELQSQPMIGQTTFRLDQDDHRAISLIRDHYGLNSVAEAIRYSLLRLYQILM